MRPPGPHLRTAHDVRHLRRCAGCGGVGDSRLMLSVQLPSQVGLHHGCCAIQLLGADGVLALAPNERAKITLSDAGVTLMRRLLEADDAGGVNRLPDGEATRVMDSLRGRRCHC